MASKPAPCPPHRWMIEFVRTDSGRAESWTCSPCSAVRLVEREDRAVWGTSPAVKKRPSQQADETSSPRQPGPGAGDGSSPS